MRVRVARGAALEQVLGTQPAELLPERCRQEAIVVHQLELELDQARDGCELAA
jgi:hypothetical protein